MKNVLGYGLIGGLMLTCMVGCGKKATPENLMADMNKNAKQVTSMGAEANVNVVFGEGDAGVAINLNMDMKQLNDPYVSHTKMTVDVEMFGQTKTIETEMYQLQEDDKYLIYSKDSDSDEWSYQEGPNTQMLDSSILDFTKNMEESFELEQETKKLSGKECFVLNGHISVKDLLSISKNPLFDDFDLGDVFGEEGLKDEKIAVELWVYRDKILPAYMSVDMSDVLSKTEETIEESQFDFTFKTYNKIDNIPVPPEIEDMKNSGVNKKAEDKNFEAIEALGENWNTTMVQIDNTLITLPCSISDLQKTGFELEQEYAMEEGPIATGDYGYSYFIDENENQILVELYNDSEQPQEMAACKVGGIHVTGDEIEESQVPVAFPGGVRIGMDIEEVQTLYGMEYEKEEQDEYLVYTWFEEADHYKACEITVDGETGVIVQMGMQNTLY